MRLRSILAASAAVLALSLTSSVGNASLSVTGVWEAGVWETTVWADGVWREGDPVVPVETDAAPTFIGLKIGV
ncbi:MAG: hypothetical protein KDA32_13750 [Phycisphaerales bacterium]|nr:hypothetical protein [Phycisphaerales bacterium]